VQAAGAVAAPGVYSLPAGARVHELISMAGGVTADGDPAAIALAVVLVDGERVYVPRLGEIVPIAPVPPPVTGTGAATPTGPLDLNRATAEQLDGLPGVGPATAAAIVAHRDHNGPFASVEGLLDVRGIGPAKLDGLRDLVTV
jgi:competence protein ComEA